MHEMTQPWIRGLFCLMVAVAAPAGVPGATQTAPAKAAPPADPTAVLKVIPADATAFLAVRNLKELDADVLGIAQKLGLPLGPNSAFPGPLAFAQENTGIADGLNENGSLALVLLSCTDLESVAEIPTRLAILIPCSDADAMIKSLGGEKDGDLFKVTLMGDESAAAEKDGFLVVAENVEVVQQIMRAKGGGIIKSMSPDRVKAFAAQGLFGWASFRGISKQIREEVANTLRGLMLMGKPTGGAAQAENTVMQLTKLVDESQEFSFGLTLNQKTGLTLSFYSRMRPDTEFGKQVAAMKVADGSLLMALPNEPTVFAMGCMGASGVPGYEKQMRQMLDQFLNENSLGETVKPDSLKTLKDSIVKLVTTAERLSLGVSGLPAESEEGLIAVTIVAKVANGRQWQDATHEAFDIVKGILIGIGRSQEALNEEEMKGLNEAVQWKKDAEQLSGAAVDHLVVELEKIPDVEAEDIEEIKSVIGKEGILVRIAAVGDDHVVITFGGGQKRFARIAQYVREGQAPLSENKTIKLVTNRLPTRDRTAEGYLSIDRLFALIMDIGNKVGQPIPVPLAMKETTPIAFTSIKVGDTGQQADILIPIELVESVKQMLEPLIGMMLMPAGGMEPLEQTEEVVPAPAPDSELR